MTGALPTAESIKETISRATGSHERVRWYIGAPDTFEVDENGLLVPSAVIWLSVMTDLFERQVATPDAGLASMNVVCLGASVDACMWVGDEVRSAFSGLRLPGGGVLKPDMSSDTMGVEPGSDPPRYRVAIRFAAYTQGVTP